jgi:peroxiredoxin
VRNAAFRLAALCALALPLLPSQKILSSPASLGASAPLDAHGARAAVPAAPAPTGLWHAALVPTPEYPVLFDIRIATARGRGLAAFLVNGALEVPFTSASWDGTVLTLELAHYDAKIVAEKKGDGLEGTYTRVVASGLAEVAFAASRSAPALPAAPPDGKTLAGTWGFEMGVAPAAVDKLTGLFDQKGAALSGTLLSVTGDYGALHGWFDGERFLLTVFDGVHVYRFDGELLPDGTLAGEYRSRTNPPVPFRARRLEPAAAAAYLPPASGIVRARDPAAPYVFAYPDADGKMVSSSDARYAGKPMVVTFTGTWCPNCFDEAPVLRDLHAAWGPKGVEVVALSFEYTDDGERNRRQVKRFIERHGLKYPVLLAGTTTGARASQAVAQLEGWEGYPTTLFLDRSHRIVRTLSGFDGPATGERFAKAKRELEDGFKAILK